MIAIIMMLMMVPLSSAQQPNPADNGRQDIENQITAVLTAQAAAWNEGNIDGYMEHYWKSDQLSFCSGGQRQMGWNKVHARYRQRYPTPEKMGKLSFTNLDIRPLEDAVVLVIGDWALARAEDNPGGNFSLILQRFDGRWVIVHDHTSSGE